MPGVGMTHVGVRCASARLEPLRGWERFSTMSEKTLFCEECVEDIEPSEVYLEDDRLYCKVCGSELESPDRDLFEEIEGNIDNLHFRDNEEEELEPPDGDKDGMSIVKS